MQLFVVDDRMPKYGFTPKINPNSRNLATSVSSWGTFSDSNDGVFEKKFWPESRSVTMKK